ncbi:MAG: MaoC family dehydratase N-terminal domain-containing protein [Alphaproteobacteria bacterium]
MTADSVDYAAWLGRRESVEDVIAPGPAARLAATLDCEGPAPRAGDPLPPCWHWIYFLDATLQTCLGPDGHGARGGFLPPVDLLRRMWAGGRIRFPAPLRIGETARRESEIVSITPKQGRRGRLVFVTVRHRVSGERGLAIEEEHDIVYREAPTPGEPAPSPEPPPVEAQWRRRVTPDPVFLFRYSALTFNGHRIHYDRDYVTRVEGYPGLVVHGPLLATLLLDLLRRERPGDTVARFDYRALAPLFDSAPFEVAGAPATDGGSATLWAERPEGGMAMVGAADFAVPA